MFDSVSSLRVSKNNLNQEILQQKKLIGTISHDIKSPLKFLTITAKHLYEKSILSEDKNIKDHAKIMNDSALELYKFVENLVDYSKVFMEHHDEKKSKKENIDVVINEKINLFKNIANENKVEIIYKNFVPFPIEFNKKAIGIIIHNLLDNAVKNTLAGKITLEVNLTKNRIYISVEDTGIGMKNEIKDYYIKMQKNYETDKLVIQNYGLGLHMVLELLRMLKGELIIESKEGKGTIVTIICDDVSHNTN